MHNSSVLRNDPMGVGIGVEPENPQGFWMANIIEDFPLTNVDFSNPRLSREESSRICLPNATS